MNDGREDDVPPTTRARVYRTLEALFEERYPGTRWSIRYDPQEARRRQEENAKRGATDPSGRWPPCALT